MSAPPANGDTVIVFLSRIGTLSLYPPSVKKYMKSHQDIFSAPSSPKILTPLYLGGRRPETTGMKQEPSMAVLSSSLLLYWLMIRLLPSYTLVTETWSLPEAWGLILKVAFLIKQFYFFPCIWSQSPVKNVCDPFCWIKWRRKRPQCCSPDHVTSWHGVIHHLLQCHTYHCCQCYTGSCWCSTNLCYLYHYLDCVMWEWSLIHFLWRIVLYLVLENMWCIVSEAGDDSNVINSHEPTTSKGQIHPQSTRQSIK